MRIDLQPNHAVGRFLLGTFRTVSLSAAILLAVGTRAALAQDELFVTNGGGDTVTVYARTANGNTAPLRTISGAATGLSTPRGLAVDTVNNELAVANAGSGGNGSITVYPLAANGNVAPLRTISFATVSNNTIGLALDAVNNEFFVAIGSPTNSVLVFARTANGNVAPLRTISGAATGLNNPFGVAVDIVNNEVAVANNGGNSVTVYARTANGNVAPLRTISGAATGLSGPLGLAVDTVNNELAVVNPIIGNSSVTVYARTANGNVAPLRTLQGAATGFNIPIFVGITTGGAPPTPTPTNTPTNTPAGVATNTPTNTPTGAPTNTPTNTPTGTPSNTPTRTPTAGQSPAVVVPTLSFPMLGLLALALAAAALFLFRRS
jgi:DNA-binding beta-propeller fold protein YncE